MTSTVVGFPNRLFIACSGIFITGKSTTPIAEYVFLKQAKMRSFTQPAEQQWAAASGKGKAIDYVIISWRNLTFSDI